MRAPSGHRLASISAKCIDVYDKRVGSIIDGRIGVGMRAYVDYVEKAVYAFL